MDIRNAYPGDSEAEEENQIHQRGSLDWVTAVKSFIEQKKVKRGSPGSLSKSSSLTEAALCAK